MGPQLVLLALAVFAAANPSPTRWFRQSDLSEFHVNSLISRDCFRGTYGSLSLFTCPLQHVHIEPFAEVSSGIQLCVIETLHHEVANRIVARSADVQVLFNDQEKYIIVGSFENTKTYPELCSRSEFQGSALNVYTIPNHPIRPSTVNVLAGKEKQVLSVIQDFIDLVDPDALQHIDTQLAFGEPSGAWVTRNSYSPQAARAVDWIASQFELYGARVSQFPFRSDMCNDVVAEFPGILYPNEIVVVGSHADSRAVNNSSPTDTAPGADDNGTGTAINLLFAKLIQLQGLTFSRTLRLITFCGEEQGLIGSRAIAQNYKNNGVNVVGMFNADMVGYLRPNTTTTIAFMTGSATPDFTQSCKDITNTYLPGTAVGNTGACCSDQQAFYENGFPSLGVFETPTNSVAYPDYHRATDTPDKVSFGQVALFAKSIYSCALSATL